MAAGDLCAIADVQALVQKTYSGSTTPTSTEVTNWITDLSGVIADMTGYKYSSNTATSEKHDGNGTPYIMLNYFPVLTVTSLVVDTDTLVANTDYWLKDADAGIIECLTNPYMRTENNATGQQNITVTYTYGITTISKSLKQLCAVMVALKAISADALANNPGGILKQYSDGDVSLSYQDGDRAAAGLLEQYKQLRENVPSRVKMQVGGP